MKSKIRHVLTLILAALLPPSAIAGPGSWEPLFDGSGVSAWKTYQKSDDTPLAWVVEGDTLAWRKGCGHIISRKAYDDFELELEWRISPAGNSGIMFRVDGIAKIPWQSGPEIQLLDNARHGNGKNPLTTSGAIYGMYPPLKAADRPVGEWNAFRLQARGPVVQAWVNGEKIVDIEIGNADWQARLAKSKFVPFPGFARSARGGIVLQDHGNPVWFRKIRIRSL